VRRARSESVTAEEIDLDAREAEGRGVAERYEALERAGRSAEALRALKHDEALALMLKAEGFSYQEIGSRLSWTYTKVNRCITEGRRRFLRVYGELESGEGCERFAPALAALADGAATSEQLVALRPHLRHCGTCRATVRELHGSPLSRAAGFLPVTLVLAPVRWLQALAARSDLVTSVQLASSAGGGRSAGVAALVGLCLTGAGPACLRAEPPVPLAGERSAEVPRAEPARRAAPVPPRPRRVVVRPAGAAAPRVPTTVAGAAPQARATVAAPSLRARAVAAPSRHAPREFAPAPAATPRAAPTAGEFAPAPAPAAAAPAAPTAEFAFESAR